MPRDAYLYEIPGLTAFDAGVRLQQDLAAALSQHAVPETLILLEHEPVVTLGSATDEEAELPSRALLEARGIAVREASRGGKATWHGPGQLVGYPILDLTNHGRDVREYVRMLQRALVGTLADLGVEGAEGRTEQEFIGVWVGERKVASIGLHVARWITTHGFALNLSNDLAPFGLFTPCGLLDAEFTTASREAAREISREEASAALLRRLGEELDLVFEPLPVGAAG